MTKIQELTAKATGIGAMTVALGTTALAVTDATTGAQNAAPTGTGGKVLFGPGGAFQTITNTLIFIIGAVAVLMLIIGGFRYVLSSGSSDAVQGAKNTILYAVIGIVVAVLAFAIVNFVLVKIGG